MSTIFWNVDTAYDFMRDDESFKGALAIPGARAIERNLAKLTNLAKEKKIKVVNTADWHKRNSSELSDNPDLVNTFPPHCLQDTKGARFVPATDPENPYKVGWENEDLDLEEIKKRRNIIIYKDKFDVFTGNPKTEQIVRIINPSKALVYGVATNVCVDKAVLGLLERDIEVYVPIDAIKELPNIPLPYDNWEKLEAKFVTTKDVLEGRI
jgi:nicotinamidase/pyrazinamidase